MFIAQAKDPSFGILILEPCAFIRHRVRALNCKMAAADWPVNSGAFDLYCPLLAVRREDILVKKKKNKQTLDSFLALTPRQTFCPRMLGADNLLAAFARTSRRLTFP